MPIAVIYGHPSDNIHCIGFNKDNWVDSAAGNYVAWFSDKIGAGSKYIVIWIKIIINQNPPNYSIDYSYNSEFCYYLDIG